MGVYGIEGRGRGANHCFYGVEGHTRGAVGGFNGVGGMFGGASSGFQGAKSPAGDFGGADCLRSQGVLEVASLKIDKKLVSKFSALRAEIFQIVQIFFFLLTYN